MLARLSTWLRHCVERCLIIIEDHDPGLYRFDADLKSHKNSEHFGRIHIRSSFPAKVGDLLGVKGRCDGGCANFAVNSAAIRVDG